MIEASFPWQQDARHWRDAAIAWGASRLVRPTLALPLGWPVHRAAFRAAGALRAVARPRGISHRTIPLGPHGALEISPPAPARRLLWIHGGGFVVGAPETHLGMLSHLAQAANACILAPRYRLAPEHPFPAAADDAEAAACAALKWRREAGPLFFGGDSAGGCLALVALAHVLQRGQSVAGTLLFSPATLIDPNRAVPRADDLLFPVGLLHRIGADYAGAADPSDPRLSPIYGVYTGAGPTLIQCVSGEFLEEDSDALATRMAAQGVDIRVEKATNAPHVWQFMAGTSPLADAAIRRAGQFIISLS